MGIKLTQTQLDKIWALAKKWKLQIQAGKRSFTVSDTVSRAMVGQGSRTFGPDTSGRILEDFDNGSDLIKVRLYAYGTNSAVTDEVTIFKSDIVYPYPSTRITWYLIWNGLQMAFGKKVKYNKRLAGES